MTAYTPAVGDLQVVYIPQVPMKAYEVNVGNDLKLAQTILAALVGLSIFEFENRVKVDYSDLAMICRWEPDGDDGFGWFDVEEEELEGFADFSDNIFSGRIVNAEPETSNKFSNLRDFPGQNGVTL